MTASFTGLAEGAGVAERFSARELPPAPWASYPEELLPTAAQIPTEREAWELYSLVKPGLRTAPMSLMLHSTTAHGRPHSQSTLTGVEKWTPPPEQSCGEVTL